MGVKRRGCIILKKDGGASRRGRGGEKRKGGLIQLSSLWLILENMDFYFICSNMGYHKY